LRADALAERGELVSDVRFFTDCHTVHTLCRENAQGDATVAGNLRLPFCKRLYRLTDACSGVPPSVWKQVETFLQ
jgi:hypothetical protein